MVPGDTKTRYGRGPMGREPDVLAGMSTTGFGKIKRTTKTGNKNHKKKQKNASKR